MMVTIERNDQPLLSAVVTEALELVEERLPVADMRPKALAMAAAESAVREGMSREQLLDWVALAYAEGERPLESNS